MMRLKLSLLFSSLLLLGCQQSDMAADAATPAKVAANATHPVVVELFQSQGCSSCPPANAALNAIADRTDLIALNFSVTYWDKLGWKDIFGSPAYTQRQYDYAKTLATGDGAYTPQIVINGARAIVGNGRGELARAVSNSAPVAGGPAISADASMVKLGAGSGSANVWLVRYDPRIQNVAIRSGENSGRTLPHKNIVRQLVKLGAWNGKDAGYALPKANFSGLRTAILVQSTKGPILSARVI